MEILLTSIWFDGATIDVNRGPLTSLLANWGAWALRWAVGFAGIFGTFAYLRYQPALGALKTNQPVRVVPMLAHLAVFSVFLVLSQAIYGARAVGDWAVAAWALGAVGVVLTAARAFVPWSNWRSAGRITGPLAFYSAAAAAIACAATPLVRGLWEPTTRLTFWLVKVMLSTVVSDLVLQPERLRLGTPHFTVIISPECSGLEGIGLMLIFGSLWLILFRDELRFARAVWLLPAGMALIYLANAVRITALVLLGTAGARDVAVRGFHSQAGWIAFNLVAFALLIGARRLAWFTKGPVVALEGTDHYSAAPFLMPFLAILAAGMVAGALSSGFEWLYFLRVVAGGWALWHFRKELTQVDFGVGWLAPVIGVAVFALWLPGSGAPRGMPSSLASAPTAWAIAWMTMRTIGGVIVVPIAEELAFRGFGWRRLIADDFEAVPWRKFTWPALLISSLLFGIMHGDRWPAGTAAGVLYGLAMIWRGRLGDAIAAHAVTNGLLAIRVLALGRWESW